jgi:hypothetical protein
MTFLYWWLLVASPVMGLCSKKGWFKWNRLVNNKRLKFQAFICAPGGTRIHNLSVRSALLYPFELLGQATIL